MLLADLMGIDGVSGATGSACVCACGGGVIP